MKQNSLLRLLILICMVMGAVVLTAERFYTFKSNTGSHTEAGNRGNPKPAAAEVVIWQSLYQHLLTFN